VIEFAIERHFAIRLVRRTVGRHPQEMEPDTSETSKRLPGAHPAQANERLSHKSAAIRQRANAAKAKLCWVLKPNAMQIIKQGSHGARKA
jgi:hypothetical protein